MIARALIAPLSDRRAEISKTLDLHLPSSLREASVKLNHPDLLYFSDNSKLGIAEARKIKEHFSLKPYSAKGRVVILEDASNLTIEAQNALLKTLEELPANAILILGADSDAKFLPTVLSRCRIIRVQGIGYRVQGYEKDIEKLVKASLPERFEYIEKLKDKEEFLKALTIYFHQDLRLHLKGSLREASVNLNFLKELLQSEGWAEQNVNIRAILEYLMLVMPQKL